MGKSALILSCLILTSLVHYMQAQTGCGGNFNATELDQIFTSPLYPSRHPNNLNCRWVITAPISRQILLTITSLNTESCCDHLEVFDDTALINRYNGRTSEPIPMASSSQRLVITFKSDGSISNTGFRATYRLANNCGYNYTVSTALSYFSTPFYPNSHPHDMDCFWLFKAPRREEVILTFTEGNTDPCCDYIDIFEGKNRLGRIKGIISTAKTYKRNSLFVYFHSDSSTARDGFRASFQQATCGATYDLKGSDTGVITSPNYPNNTEHNFNCTYTFQAELGKRIELTIEVHTEACCDYVDVYDGRTKIGRLRGDINNTNVASTGQYLQLRYIADGSVASKGFRARYRQFLPACGFSAQAGATETGFSSPGYPTSYPSNSKCDWIISAVTGRQVVVTFTALDTEACCDYVEIFDGVNGLGKLSGTLASQVSVVSTSQTIRIRFYSDGSTEKKGFSATYKLANNCGSSKTAALPSLSTAPKISTPNYPIDHGDFLDCLWTITSPIGFQVQLNITEGETESCCDYIQVLDALKPIGNTVRGVINSLRSFTTKSNIMQVYFHSDSSGTRDGFQASYLAACNYTYDVTNTFGITVSSPNYPERSPHNARCYYYFQSPPGTRVQLSFLAINTETCCDKIKVMEGSTVKSDLSGNPSNLPTIFSTGNSLKIIYSTDSSVGSIGFRLRYQRA